MATKTKKAKAVKQNLVTFKGFDKDMKCRDMQYEVGKTYTHDGPIEKCKSGLHSCADPLNVFDYYPPGNGGRYALVEISGEMDKETNGDSKIASASLHVRAELKLPEMVTHAVRLILEGIKPGKKQSLKRSKSNATNTGDQSAATNTGNQSAATNTGYQSAATVEGKNSAAMASGREGRVAGAAGCALFLVERDYDWNIVSVWAGIAGKDGIEPGVFYMLKNGKPVKAE